MEVMFMAAPFYSMWSAFTYNTYVLLIIFEKHTLEDIFISAYTFVFCSICSGMLPSEPRQLWGFQYGYPRVYT